MTLEQANALSRYWLRQPPAHELLAAQLGYQPPEQTVVAPARSLITANDLRKLEGLERKWGLA